jgi:hypothetical protein
VEDLAGQLGRLDAVAGPGQEVAVDALDLVVVDEGERLPVAGGGAFEQGALARHLGRHVTVAAGTGGRLGVRRTLGSQGQGGWGVAFSGRAGAAPRPRARSRRAGRPRQRRSQFACG